MVSNFNEMRNSVESGGETKNYYHRLLLSGASREQIRIKLLELAEYYVAKTGNRDAQHVVELGEETKFSLQTWKL